jgi:hypothetical protein
VNITERKETLHNIMDFGVKFKIFREVFRNYHGLQEAKCNDSNKARHLLRNPQCVIHQIYFRQFTGLGALGGVVCGGILLYKGDESAFKALMSAVSRFSCIYFWRSVPKLVSSTG